MAIRDAFLPEFDHEMALTRKTLERVPEGKPDWKPHQKSMTISRLAGHLADIPGYAVMVMEKDSFDVAAPRDGSHQPTEMTSRAQLLDAFDKKVAAGRAAIARASDEHLGKTWTLRAGEKTIFCMPRAGVLRAMILSHTIHHRAQLGVYLRLNDVPVPSIYGPSADEGLT
ncbi:MAG: DinB family protein [Candidatus Acidiferrales bacterium]